MNIRLTSVILIAGAWLSPGHISAAVSDGSSTQADTTAQKSTFADFPAMRAELLSLIGGASKRVLLVTDFLTDADIVSSLYIAQYRKVEIHVLLGKDKATNILSRLSYLQQVNIKTSIRPREFHPRVSTMVLIDDRLISINSNLDYMVRSKNLAISQLPTSEISAFESAFQTAMSGPAAPEPKPMPKVGRTRPSTRRPPDAASPGSPIQTGHLDIAPSANTPEPPPPQGLTSDQENGRSERQSAPATYRYRAVKDKPHSGIPTKLPRTTISQDRERERQRAAGGEGNSRTNTESP